MSDRSLRPLQFRLISTLAGAAALALVVACQTTAPGAVSTSQPASTAAHLVEFGASDYSFSTPDTLQSGWTTIRLVNNGNEPHHGQLLRLHDGITFDQFTAALQQEGEAALRLVSGEGGPGTIDPHAMAEVTLDLKPGSYIVACFMSGPDGVPHLMKGMLKPLQVTAGGTSVQAPNASSTFTMKDFSFDVPTTLPAGRATYKVVNAGPQMHELNIVKLAPGKTANDLLEWENAPNGAPPFESAGGINAFSAEGSGFMTLDLQPGSYLAICHVPDPQSGLPHNHLGMLKEFTVPG